MKWCELPQVHHIDVGFVLYTSHMTVTWHSCDLPGQAAQPLRNARTSTRYAVPLTPWGKNNFNKYYLKTTSLNPLSLAWTSALFCSRYSTTPTLLYPAAKCSGVEYLPLASRQLTLSAVHSSYRIYSNNAFIYWCTNNTACALPEEVRYCWPSFDR